LESAQRTSEPQNAQFLGLVKEQGKGMGPSSIRFARSVANGKLDFVGDLGRISKSSGQRASIDNVVACETLAIIEVECDSGKATNDKLEIHDVSMDNVGECFLGLEPTSAAFRGIKIIQIWLEDNPHGGTREIRGDEETKDINVVDARTKVLAGGLEATVIQLGFFLVHLGLVFFSKALELFLGKLGSDTIKEFRKVSINGKHVDRRDLMGDTRAVSIERTSQDIEVGEGNYKGGVELVGIPSVALFDGFVARVDSFKELVKMLTKHFRAFILGVIEDGGEGVTQFGRNQLFGASFSNNFIASIKQLEIVLDVLGFLAISLGSGRGISVSRTNASGNRELYIGSIMGGGWSRIGMAKSSRDIF
jgi:hypothetical protein